MYILQFFLTSVHVSVFGGSGALTSPGERMSLTPAVLATFDEKSSN